jgi:outer membrane protein TolC
MHRSSCGGRAAIALLLSCLSVAAQASLTLDEAARLARSRAPTLTAQQNVLAAAQAMRPAAGTLPDPRLTAGIDNFPIAGPDRYRLTGDFMTMQRIGLVQEVPNRAKREARMSAAEARVQREEALLTSAELAVRREVMLAWLAVYFAEQRAGHLATLERENRLLLETVDARIGAGKAMPADRTMARQEALTLADRRDDARRDVGKARAALRRWVAGRADEPLSGEPPVMAVDPDAVRAALHRHAELAPYEAMQAIAQADAREAIAEQRGDWAWEVVYSRRGAQFGDMVSVQFSFDLPWQKDRRQQPQIAARQREIDRIEAEREETLRRHQEEVEGELAQLEALDAQRSRLQQSGLALADERIALTMAAYQSGRGDLAGVLAARREALEARLRLLDLDTQRAALRVRLNTLSVEP